MNIENLSLGSSNFSNMVFKRTIFFSLLQHLVILSGQDLSGYHHHHNQKLRHSLLTDKAALLTFKSTISLDPHSTLANWNETTDVCNFTGVKCNKQHHRVRQLQLNQTDLVGLLSPFISNLTHLRILELVDNQLFGIIPPEFSVLQHLIYLQLDGNNLHGKLPGSLSVLSNLKLVTISRNSLSGTIPPSFFSNCTALLNIDLSQNSFTGKIPPEIGNCHVLWNLNLYNNQFTGEIPASIMNVSKLYNLDLEYNNISGELPRIKIASLPELGYLHLSFNKMVSYNHNTNLDPFFAALANCSTLEELELAGMGLGGRLPSSVGQLSNNLRSMLLQENKIYGSIPPGMANLSYLRTMNLSSNLLNGTIAVEISQLPLLEQFFLSHNFFTGEIPAALGQFPNLGLLDLSHNKFSGNIPDSLGNLVKVNSLFLNDNLLSGAIPSSLAQCKDLYKLDLSYNRLTGEIPPAISRIREIRIFINLSHNNLEGPLPIELSKLENVQEIDLSWNNLTGHIFLQISSCIALRKIDLSHNSLYGNLPESLGDLKNLETFDVSRNYLSGEIPTSLNKIHTLTFLNLSCNDFSGMIPSGGIFKTLTNLSFLQNPQLCGSIPGIPPLCHKSRHIFRPPLFLVIFFIVIAVSAFFSTVCCVLGCRRLKGMISYGKTETSRKAPPDLMHNFPRITYKELSEATGDFDDQRLIGAGSYGRVYKGVLRDETPIAVKVLQFKTGNSMKSFNRECQVLKRIRHRNLIRIITACSLPDFKAIVLPYMANGSLDSRLYPHPGTGLGSGSSDLSLIQRINICSDIAQGMAYLHHYSPVKVVHCDLKPSNVLLNDDMTALVSDFGISRLIMTVEAGNAGIIENMGNSTANMLCGSIGYIAPEYGFGSSTSTKGDVYSFGIIVLEMVTRKRPTDDMFAGELSLQRWVKSHYHRQMERVVDSSLARALKDQNHEVRKMWEVAIAELIEMGILCTQESPFTRPTMLDAADDLDRLKRYLSGDTTTTFASSLGISSSTIGDD